jgi:hypothetical protein
LCSVVHQTMTFRSLEYNEHNVVVHGRPTTRDSWFPGYAWRIVSCARCYSHLGWKFKLVMRAGDAAHAAADASPSSSSRGGRDGDVDIDAADETTAAIGLMGSAIEAGTTNGALIDVEENEDLGSVYDDHDDDDDDDDDEDDDDDDEDGLSYNTADAEMDQEAAEYEEEDLDESVPRVVRRAVVFW